MSVALAMAGVSVASSLLGSSSKDDSWKTDARRSGQNKAQLDAARSRAASLLPGKAREIADAALAASVQTQGQELAAVSEATVQAAASGAAGANVDQSIQSIEGNAERAQLGIEKQRRAGMLQVNQDYEDIWWEAENKKYDVQVRGGSSTGRNLASAALSGLGAYFGNL